MLIKKLALLSVALNLFGSVLWAQEAKRKEVNVLLLGKSGSGKSSLINVFYNHLSGRAYEEEHYVVVPYVHLSKVFSVNIEEYKSYNMLIQDDMQSQTKEIHSYRVKMKDFDVVFYDTPGIPDTEGEEADKIHIRKIKNELATTEIHAVMVVLPQDIFERRSQEFLKTMGALVNSLPSSFSKNIIGVFNRVGHGSLDEDTKIHYRAQLSTYFSEGSSSKKIRDFYIDGSSFFMKTVHSANNWAADSLIVANIIKQVEGNQAGNREEVVDFQKTLVHLTGSITMLNSNVKNAEDVRGMLEDASTHLDSEKKRRDENKNYAKKIQIPRIRYEYTHCGHRGCTVYQESEEFCKKPQQSCHSTGGGGQQTAAMSQSCSSRKTHMESGACQKIDYYEIQDYTDQGQLSAHNAAIKEIEKYENTILENKDKPAEITSVLQRALGEILSNQTRREQLSIGTRVDLNTESTKEKLKEIHKNQKNWDFKELSDLKNLEDLLKPFKHLKTTVGL